MSALRWTVAVRALAVALGACGCPAEPAGDGQPTAVAAPVMPEPAHTSEPAQATHATLLAWLDPNAIAVAWTLLPSDLDIDAFTTVFAVPPRAARLLQDAAEIELALDAVLPADAPRPATWLGRETIAFTSLVASGTYVLRPLLRPSDEVVAALEHARMRAETYEGFTILVPNGPLPWKVAILDGNAAAFIPAREIGSGLGPLTAGRDLPEGTTEGELRRALDEDPKAALELYAAGPLLHFDLGHDVVQFGLRARAWQAGGLDVEMRLLPDGEASVAAAALKARDVSLETPTIRALCERVAYSVDGTFVEGRLQLTDDDVDALRRR